MYDIVGKRNWYFAFSALITIPGLIFIILGGLKPSVDYTGGTVWQVRYARSPSAAQVQAALVKLGHPEAKVRGRGRRLPRDPDRRRSTSCRATHPRPRRRRRSPSA